MKGERADREKQENVGEWASRGGRAWRNRMGWLSRAGKILRMGRGKSGEEGKEKRQEKGGGSGRERD
jgi:hypothetical protein